MPKGALLRADSWSLADIDHIIETALRTPGVCISCPSSHLATAEARKEASLCIQFRDKVDAEDCSLWTDDYKPGTFISLAKAADSYPGGGRGGFMEWLKEKCMMPMQNANLRVTTTASSGGTDLTARMLFYEPIWRAFLQRLMTNLVEDGISWLELR
jgi:adenosine deaminase CECR1